MNPLQNHIAAILSATYGLLHKDRREASISVQPASVAVLVDEAAFCRLCPGSCALGDQVFRDVHGVMAVACLAPGVTLDQVDPRCGGAGRRGR